MENCIFCKIAEGTIPSIKVYEDEEFLAFQALGQASPGHTLLIPKEHSEDFLEMNSKLSEKMNSIAQKIGKAMMKALSADGMNISFNIKPAGGQEIMHTHMHLVPRFEKDGLKLFPLTDASEEERIMFAGKIIKEL